MENQTPIQHRSGQKHTGHFRWLRMGSLIYVNAVCVAALYYNHTVLRHLSEMLPASKTLMLVPPATLAGYAVGVGYIAIGPRTSALRDARALLTILATSLVAAGTAPDAGLLALASFGIGFGGAATQRVLPAIAGLAGPVAMGRAIGTTISVALAGLLLVRLFGEDLNRLCGWRNAFWLMSAAVACALLTQCFSTQIPKSASAPTSAARSGLRLWRMYPALRRAALQQCAVFGAYQVCWISVFLNVRPSELSVAVLCGCSSGFISAYVAGRFCDTRNRTRVSKFGLHVASAGSVALLPLAFAFNTWQFHGELVAAGLSLVEAGTQAALVANQATVQALDESSRERLAATVTVFGFGGGALAASFLYATPHTPGWGEEQIAIAAFFSAAGLLASHFPTRTGQGRGPLWLDTMARRSRSASPERCPSRQALSPQAVHERGEEKPRLNVA